MAVSDQQPAKFRWWIAALILLGATAAQIVLWNLWSTDRTYQVFSVLYIWPATLFALLLWWTFLSGLRWKIRLIGVGLIAVAASVLALLVRIEEWNGAMIPRLGYRWSTTPEQQSQEFFANRPTTPGPIETAGPPLEISADDWAEFRGPNRDGIAPEMAIRTDWDENPPKELWRRPIGLGWSSFAVVDGLAWTQEQRGDEELIVCYDLATGEEQWVHADKTRLNTELGGDGPRATPTIHDSRLYALGGTGLLTCLEARTGKLHWQRFILADAEAENAKWGMAGSPLVVDDLVIVNPGGESGQSVIAYDRLTGEKVWTSGTHRAAYASPQLATLHEVRQVLIFDAEGLSGYAVEDGRHLWSFPWTNNERINAAQPIELPDDTIFISSGYAQGCVRLQFTPKEDEWDVKPLWTSRELKLKFNGAVAKDGYVYGLDEGILVCVDLETGKRTWKAGRYRYGQLLLVGELILVMGEHGDVALVEADPKRFREVTRFQALEGKTWNCPVLVNGQLLIRNAAEAACFDVSAI